jgi:SAM-dependent methyltransferase
VTRKAERDPWYASWFGEEYLALYPERDDREANLQAIFVRELLAPNAARGRVKFLDLACGTGRHAVALDGYDGGVVGLDLSATLLFEALRRPQRPRPGYVRADMRQLPFQGAAFGAVVNFFTSFGYFDDPADDVLVLREVARILAPGGAFLSDVFNMERLVGSLASREEKTVAGERVSISRRYDPVTRKVEKEIEMGSGAGRRVFRERVRAYREEELRALHRAAGLSVVAQYGEFDASPFDPRRSPRLILFAEKPMNGRRPR